jgi:DNA-binding NarL/FixJ family response regulator
VVCRGDKQSALSTELELSRAYLAGSGVVMGLSFTNEKADSNRADANSVVRILLVDDNPSVRRCLRGVLEQHDNWRVCDEARDGRDAVDRFAKIRPDLIVLDFQMPRMNGLDAARIITERSPEIPILIVTLYISKQLVDEARKVGARGACSKGNISAVVDAVGALLRHETYFPN